MNIIKLCPACEKSLLAEIADLPNGAISGYFCSHAHAAAVVVSESGSVKYAQVSGPCSEEQAQALMAISAMELIRGAATWAAATGAEGVRH